MGGFGGAVLEALAAAGAVRPVRCLALPDRLIEHGDPNEQKAAFGLDAAGIARAVQQPARQLAEEPAARRTAGRRRARADAQPGRGADPRRSGAGRRHSRRQARDARARGSARAPARRDAAFRLARRREARGRARRSRGRSRGQALPRRRAPRPAASPTACSRPARAASSRSTSATASSRPGCARIRASSCSSAGTRARSSRRDVPEPIELVTRRRLVHLRAAAAPGARPARARRPTGWCW